MEEIQMNPPMIIKMLSDERIREYTAGASRAAARGWPARHRMASIAHWVSTARTNLVHGHSTSTSDSSAQCCPAT
jgi:hypothetical protein